MTAARGTLVHRQNMALSLQAHERYVERLNRRRGGGRAGIQIVSRRAHGRGPEPPEVHEETIRFWWDPRGRLREEVTSNVETQTRTTIVNGELWWLYGSAVGAITNALLDDEERASHHVGGGERLRPLLDPSWLIPAVELDEIRAGDGVLHVDARLRDDLDGPQHFHLHLVGGADRFGLEVDAELGIVRATTAWLDGAELSSTRFEELVLGEPLPEVFAPPADVEFERAGGHAAELPLDEASAAAPFPVFYVPELPDGVWRLGVHCSRKPTFTVWLVYHRSDGRESFTVSQSSELLFEPEGDEIERDGTTYVVGERALAFERDGTKLLLQSDELAPQALLELATSLRRFGA